MNLSEFEKISDLLKILDIVKSLLFVKFWDSEKELEYVKKWEFVNRLVLWKISDIENGSENVKNKVGNLHFWLNTSSNPTKFSPISSYNSKLLGLK